MFAIELMMPEVSVRTFLPVALATGTATFIGQLVLRPATGLHRAARCPRSARPSGVDRRLALYALLGAVIGLAATAFMRGLHLRRGLFERIANPLSAPCASACCWSAR